jgi:hypothetical protein
MKSSIEFTSSPYATPASEGLGSGRDQWPRWAEALRRYQLHDLVGWFLDAGRPLSFLSAQFLYMASPFVGIGAERVGRLLESDEESEAFARLLRADKPRERRAGGEQAG